MRAGVSTGLVLLGEVGATGELTVTGDPVRLASRLQQEAPVGGVLISHDTYRHVRGVFDVHPPGSSRPAGAPSPSSSTTSSAPSGAPSACRRAASRASRRAWSGASPNCAA